jgi:hypothetical protein
MIDLKELRGLCVSAINQEAWYGVGDLVSFAYEFDKHFVANASPDVVLQLLDMLEAAQKDAARYQWLLDKCTAGDWSKVCGPYSQMLMVGASLDEAIDAAMAATKD